jgi:hypothetical protein
MSRLSSTASIILAFVLGSVLGSRVAQGQPAPALESRVAALEAWQASAGVFQQDKRQADQPWVFAPAFGPVQIRSSKINANSTAASGKVTIAAGPDDSTSVQLDARGTSPTVLVP